MTADPRASRSPSSRTRSSRPGSTAPTAGYGVIQLPPAGLDADVAREWLAQAADQVAEFGRNGYEVGLAGDGAPWRAELESALAALGVEPLPPAPVVAASLRRHAAA